MTAMQNQLYAANNNQQQILQNAANNFLQQQQASMVNAVNKENNNPTGGWPTQQPWSNMMPQGICQPAPNTNTYRGNNKEKTPYRCFENQNYCWTHGHHIEDDHTSTTCTMPKPGHQHAATKYNTMGGTEQGAHKTIMPSQSGCKRQTQKQKAATQPYLMWRAAGVPSRRYQTFLRTDEGTTRYTTNVNECTHDGGCNATSHAHGPTYAGAVHTNANDANDGYPDVASTHRRNEDVVTTRGGGQM